MKVYVATEGSYADYHISAIFSSREKAEEYMGNMPDRFNEIEEYELDSEPPRVFGQQWVAALKLDGSVDAHYTHMYITDVPVEHRQGERGWGETKDYGFMKADRFNYAWFSGRSFVSAEHAHKLAVEQRQKALVEHPEWFEGVK